MSTKKVQQHDLNLSGFSPLKLNTSATKSPAVKDYGVIDSIENIREKLLAGYEKWKVATSNGQQCINMIHGAKEKAKTSSDYNCLNELENYCSKLDNIRAVYGSVISQVSTFISQMQSSLNLLATMNESEELRRQITSVDKFLSNLKSLYEKELQIRLFVIENIAHASSAENSHLLIASWLCSSTSSELYRLMSQLKVSPNDYRWMCT